MMRMFPLALGLVLLAAPGFAQEEDGRFATSLSLGATLTDGNSDTVQAHLALVTERERAGHGAIRAGIEGRYAETRLDAGTETTAEQGRAFVNKKVTLSDATFASLNVSAFHDNVARIQYRATLSPGLGAYLARTDRTSMFLEAGPSYIWERVARVRDDYLALRLAARLEHALGDTSKTWLSAEYLPRADDFPDFLLNAELGVEASLNTRMNLRLVLQNRHGSRPASDRERNDLSLLAGLTLSL